VTPPPAGRLPNILVVVMDCARQDVFSSEVARGRYTPFLSGLRKSSIEFTGAISPGSWTIPSHASLFTGLYPWDHGAHCKAGTKLPSEPETLAASLSRAGYATAAFSANGYVQPASGLTRGFGEASWGGDKEFFLRFLSLAEPTNPDLGGPGAAAFGRLPDSPNPSPLWNSAIAALSKYTGLWDGLNRAGAKFLGHPMSDLPLIAPWIEPKMEAWLRRVPPDRPAFAFVNLLENHEPYLVDAGQPVSIRRWISYLRDVQGEYVWVQGRWVPTPGQVARGRERYARSFQATDERLRRLVSALERTGRWENTVLFLTSDHGQAFLEHETLYHRFRVEEELSRIPLWVTGPAAPGPVGRSVDRWVSLIDIPRTITELVGGSPFGDPSARSLLASGPEAEDRPVHSMTDGLLPNEQAELPAARRDLLDRLEVATYRGPLKGIASAALPPRVFTVSGRIADTNAPPAAEGPGADAMRALAQAAFDTAQARIASKPSHGSLERRLAGWGY
jgi:arylsulfatase A-like enzyme